MKILIVDDSLSARYFLKNCIPEKTDYQVIEAVDGKEGLEQFQALRPDITFLDITMPVMDGFAALEEMIKIDPHALIAVLSSDIQKKTMRRILSLGAFLFLQKPPTAKIITDAIDKAQKIRESGQSND